MVSFKELRGFLRDVRIAHHIRGRIRLKLDGRGGAIDLPKVEAGAFQSLPDRTLGLMPYLISEGMVRRLSPVPVKADSSKGIVFSQGLGWLNLPRTRALLEQVYHWEGAAWKRPRGWVDPPSGSILQLYTLVYGGYADYLLQQGDTAEAARPDSISRAVEANLR